MLIKDHNIIAIKKLLSTDILFNVVCNMYYEELTL